MIRKFIKYTFPSIFIIALLAGCSGNPATDIIGTWEGVVIRQDLTFFADGRVEMYGRNTHGVYFGEYQITDKNKLRLDFPKLSRAVERTVKVRGDKLFLRDVKGVTEEYTKKLPY